MDGRLESCLGSFCPVSCCSRGYAEPIDDFFNSYLGQNLDELWNLGIFFEFRDGKVWFKNCSDGEECKVLKYLGDGGDVRSIVCKIFPYVHNWLQYGDDKFPAVFLKPCPATMPGHTVPKKFTTEVLRLVSEHYSKKVGKEMHASVIEPIQEL